MIISSRTPEGDPNRCVVCGTRIRIEPSEPTRDAPCPACGHLLWWEVPVPRIPSDSQMHEHMRKVKRMVDVVESKLQTTLNPAEVLQTKMDMAELAPTLEAEFGVKVPEHRLSETWTYEAVLQLVFHRPQ